MDFVFFQSTLEGHCCKHLQGCNLMFLFVICSVTFYLAQPKQSPAALMITLTLLTLFLVTRLELSSLLYKNICLQFLYITTLRQYSPVSRTVAYTEVFYSFRTVSQVQCRKMNFSTIHPVQYNTVKYSAVTLLQSQTPVTPMLKTS